MLDFSKPMVVFGESRKVTFLAGPVDLRSGPRYVVYFEKTDDDDAYVGNVTQDGRICNPFGHWHKDFGLVINASP